ncbi:putative metalloendopeptidase [Povalibacter uvarum]|uniref:Putative metalloendopeptidase n=1 Tax=Povalibacter uvarum TaxID=732238 RepID=A0A841HQ02_9GAMM|nr:M13-type metalloendopeptidase [Povalibacter uvarum]MBB6094843.1 putative metalloendopeptidase [Povalibacter uvarum]
MKPSVTAAASAALILAACATDQSSAPARPSGVLLQNFDQSVRAQDDFYRHVNGQWLTTTEIPADRSNYGAFTLLAEGAERNLREILEQASAAKDLQPGSDEQKVGDLYASFMDTGTIEARGLTPLAAELAAIDAIASKRDLARSIGHLRRIGIGQPFVFMVSIDRKNSTQYLPVLTQSGLSMPDRDYYLSDDARLKGIREKYHLYVRDLLAAADTPDAEPAAGKIVALETQIAKAHWTRVQNRDAEKTYNRRDLAALRNQMAAFDWDAFFEGAKLPAAKVSAASISQPGYFDALNRLLAEVPVADWRVYLRFKVLNAYAPNLPERFANLHFEFNDRTVSGIEQIKPRWKRGVDTVEGGIGEIAGRLYVERHFSPEAKQRIQVLVDNLVAAYSQGIDDLEWMTPQTKVRAHAKLNQFTTKIGYPSKWRDWSALEIRRDDLVGNEMRSSAVEFDRDIAKLGGPVDRTEWRMTPQTVNAYYSPPSNEIVFPAAILQPPFFDPNVDDAINYGAIGSVIGHEISHGFDDQGRRYDGAGNLSDWWAPKDNEEFTQRAKALGAQYNALSPLPGLSVNGDLTMGENIADLAGVAMAYRAYHLSLKGRQAPVIDGLTGDQRFFIGWAQVWARKYRDDELRKRLLTDPHSPSEYRTNNILGNLAPFYAAFEVKQGDRMFRSEGDRVKIW